MAEWLPRLTSEDKPLSPYRVIWDLMHIADVPNTIITHDAGSPRDELSPFWKSTTPLSYIGWGKTTQLGYGLGLAMGAKLAHPDKLCVNFWGDAAIGMTGMDFETCVRAKIPILSILFNNFGMAMEFKRDGGLAREVSLHGHLGQLLRVRQGAGRPRRAGHGSGPGRACAGATASRPPRKASRCCWNSSPRRTRSIPGRSGAGTGAGPTPDAMNRADA